VKAPLATRPRIFPAGGAADTRAGLAARLRRRRVGERQGLGLLLLEPQLRLADEGPALVEIDEAGGGGSVGGLEADRLVEDVVVAGVFGSGRLGPGNAEEIAELGEEELVVGPFAAGAGAPAGGRSCGGVLMGGILPTSGGAM
jgi:hypothetical protein